MPERIVITGMGTLNPLGKSVPETWKNVVNGASGVGPITLFDATGFLVQCACEVKNFQPQDYIEPREVRRRDRFEQFASAATLEALRQSELQATCSFLLLQYFLYLDEEFENALFLNLERPFEVVRGFLDAPEFQIQNAEAVQGGSVVGMF